MRITAVSRVMNEDDIIEAFVRHTLAHVDHLLVLDNGSTDRTVEILGALKAEGAALTVLQARSPIFYELQYNTFLYQTAKLSFHPDWVIHLDADEFVDARTIALRDALAAVPPELPSVKLSLVNYFENGLGHPEPVVPRRMVHRDTTERHVHKCVVRATLGGTVVVDSGNHDVWLDGTKVATALLPGPKLAHYPARDPLQNVVKSVVGRLKVLAAGGGPELVAQRADHYTPVLAALCRDPAEIFGDRHRMQAELPGMPLLEDPIQYAGGDLRYTTLSDPAMKAVRTLATLAQQIAASHGTLLDADASARSRVEAAALQPVLLYR